MHRNLFDLLPNAQTNTWIGPTNGGYQKLLTMRIGQLASSSSLTRNVFERSILPSTHPHLFVCHDFTGWYSELSVLDLRVCLEPLFLTARTVMI